MLSFDRNVADIDDNENSVFEDECTEQHNCLDAFVNDVKNREVDYIFNVTLYYKQNDSPKKSPLDCIKTEDNKNYQLIRGMNQSSVILRISWDLQKFQIITVCKTQSTLSWQSKNVSRFATLQKDLLAFEIISDALLSLDQRSADSNSIPQGIYLIKSESIDLIFCLFQEAYNNAERQNFLSYLTTAEIDCKCLNIDPTKSGKRNEMLIGNSKTRCFSLSTDYFEDEGTFKDKLSLSKTKIYPGKSSHTMCQPRSLKYRSFDFEAIKTQPQCDVKTSLRFLPSELVSKQSYEDRNVNLPQRVYQQELNNKNRTVEIKNMDNNIIECNCKREKSSYVDLNRNPLADDNTKFVKHYDCVNEMAYSDKAKKISDEKFSKIQSSINGYTEGNGNWATLKHSSQSPRSLKLMINPKYCNGDTSPIRKSCEHTNSLKRVESGLHRFGDSRRKIDFGSIHNEEGLDVESMSSSPLKSTTRKSLVADEGYIKNESKTDENQVILRSRPVSCSSFSSTQEILDSLQESTKDLEEKILSLSLLSQTYDEPKCTKSPLAKTQDTFHIECELNPNCDCFKFWKDLPLRPFLPYDYHTNTNVQDPQSYLAKLEKRHKELPNVSLWCNNESSHEETDSGIYICNHRISNSAINDANYHNDKGVTFKDDQNSGSVNNRYQINGNQTLKPFRNRSQLVKPNIDSTDTQSKPGVNKPNLPFSTDLNKRSSMISFATCAPGNKIKQKPIDHFNKNNHRNFSQECQGNQESAPHISPLRRVIKKHFSIFNIIPKMWDSSNNKSDDSPYLKDDINTNISINKPGVQIKKETECRRNGSFYNSMPRKKNYILIKGGLNNPYGNQGISVSNTTNLSHAHKLPSDSEDLYVTMTGIDGINTSPSQTQNKTENLKASFANNHNFNSKNQLFGKNNLEIRQFA